MSERKSHFYVERGLEEFTTSGFLSESLCAVSTCVENSLFALKQFQEAFSKYLLINFDENEVLETKECKQALPEHEVLKVLLHESRKLIQSSGSLGKIMQLYANALSEIIDSFFKFKLDIGQNLFPAGLNYAEKLQTVEGLKSNLKESIFRLNETKPNFSKNSETETISKDEFNEATWKFEDCRDVFATEIFTIKTQQSDMAGFFVKILESQLDYHQKAFQALNDTIPGVKKEMENFQGKPIFGQKLQNKISPAIEVCCCVLAEFSLKQEGIFRVNGSKKKIDRLKATLNAGEFDFIGLESDPHAFASCLKLFLRELPEALMIPSLFNELMKTIQIENKNERIQALNKILQRMPQAHYTNLRYLIKFLKLVAENCDENKMTPRNLATVIAPSMFWPGDATLNLFDSRVFDLIEFMITNANALFAGEINFKSNLVEPFLKICREKKDERENDPVPNQGNESPFGISSPSPFGIGKPLRKTPSAPEQKVLIENDEIPRNLMKPLQPIPSISKKLNKRSTLPEIPCNPEKFPADEVHWKSIHSIHSIHSSRYIEAKSVAFGGLKNSPHLRRESQNVAGIGTQMKPGSLPLPPKLPPRPFDLGKKRYKDPFLIPSDQIHQEKKSEKGFVAARRNAFLKKQQILNRPPMAKNLANFSKSESHLNFL